MITVEHLIQRALDRHDQSTYILNEPSGRAARRFVDEVRKIQDKGLSVLAEDPWEEDVV